MTTVVLAPLFASSSSALKFAFEYSMAQYGLNILATLAGNAPPAGRGLVGLDGAAQAGMILREVFDLTDVQAYILTAIFCKSKTECDCCGGLVDRPEKRQAIKALADLCSYVMSGHIQNNRFREAMVARYFGDKCSLGDMAVRYRVDRDTASKHYGKVAKWLKDNESLARMAIDNRLGEIGMVGLPE